MAKFDLAKYWDFRTWVKSQIAQLRALISEYQQSGGGNTGGSGSSDFDPAGTYPNMTVGKATNADNATQLSTTPKLTVSDNAMSVTVGDKTSEKVACKTINGESIFGSGNITIAGDSSNSAELNFFAKPVIRRIREGASELSDTIQISHPYLDKYPGTEIVLMAVKRRGGRTSIRGEQVHRHKRKAWGELNYSAMAYQPVNMNAIVVPKNATFEAWQSVILHACGRIPEGLENAREPYNVNVASEDSAEFFATNGAIFVGKTPVIRLGVALRIPNPNFIVNEDNGQRKWVFSSITNHWEYKYLYSDVAEVVVKLFYQENIGIYLMGLEIV